MSHEVKALTEPELKELYNTRMTRDFPAEELRPYRSISLLMYRGNYFAFGLYDGAGSLCAYACLAYTGNHLLLDYFAVEKSMRDKGLGGLFLSKLPELCLRLGDIPFLLIEVERSDKAKDTEELLSRKRRIEFYERSGCRMSDVRSRLFGVDYSLMYLPLAKSEASSQELEEALREMYYLLVTPLIENEKQRPKVCSVWIEDMCSESPVFARDLGRGVSYLTRSRKQFMNEMLKDRGFSGAMYMILMYIEHNPGVTQDNIANHMHIDKCNVARRSKRLEELGYIRRETGVQDRRENNLYLTPLGEEQLPVIKWGLRQWGSHISSNLTDEEKDQLLSIISKMTNPK